LSAGVPRLAIPWPNRLELLTQGVADDKDLDSLGGQVALIDFSTSKSSHP
jgi:hypothetical protein